MLISKVPLHEGECKPTWLNTNQVDIRAQGGVSGWFRLTKKWGPFTIKTGPEFHGIIKDSCVYTTETDGRNTKCPPLGFGLENYI